MTLYELCQHDVICISTGKNLGKVDDISFDEKTAAIQNIVLYGRLKLFGLLGREEDVLIPWKDIRKIGRDVILVETQIVVPERKKRLPFMI
ncbi:YlmC/YmxH family sporulation protein [uncultured Ruthenibacterium sp.]|uniref:YlmC/YmxH family sporulation protein n=1 Tax=uncultured Ruthenibacterium sp. TaxID=1905347 RepID=UPI00349E72D3